MVIKNRGDSFSAEVMRNILTMSGRRAEQREMIDHLPKINQKFNQEISVGTSSPTHVNMVPNVKLKFSRFFFPIVGFSLSVSFKANTYPIFTD